MNGSAFLRSTVTLSPVKSFFNKPVSVISFRLMSSPILTSLFSNSAVLNLSESFSISMVEQLASPMKRFNRFRIVLLPLLPPPYKRKPLRNRQFLMSIYPTISSNRLITSLSPQKVLLRALSRSAQWAFGS